MSVRRREATHGHTYIQFCANAYPCPNVLSRQTSIQYIRCNERRVCERQIERTRAVIFFYVNTRGVVYIKTKNCHCVFCNTHHRMSPEQKKKENEKKNINILIITDAEWKSSVVQFADLREHCKVNQILNVILLFKKKIILWL